MKKGLITLALIAMLALAACGEKKEPVAPAPAATETPAPAPAPAPETSGTTPSN